MAKSIMATLSIDIETTAGFVEAGRDKYGIPYFHDTRSGVVTNGENSVTHSELDHTARILDNMLAGIVDKGVQK